MTDEMVEKIASIAQEYSLSAIDVGCMIEAIARAGYVLVPLEATEEMCERAGWWPDSAGREDARNVWAGFLAARPGQEKEDV